MWRHLQRRHKDPLPFLCLRCPTSPEAAAFATSDELYAHEKVAHGKIKLAPAPRGASDGAPRSRSGKRPPGSKRRRPAGSSAAAQPADSSAAAAPAHSSPAAPPASGSAAARPASSADEAMPDAPLAALARTVVDAAERAAECAAPEPARPNDLARRRNAQLRRSGGEAHPTDAHAGAPCCELQLFERPAQLVRSPPRAVAEPSSAEAAARLGQDVAASEPAETARTEEAGAHEARRKRPLPAEAEAEPEPEGAVAASVVELRAHAAWFRQAAAAILRGSDGAPAPAPAGAQRRQRRAHANGTAREAQGAQPRLLASPQS